MCSNAENTLANRHHGDIAPADHRGGGRRGDGRCCEGVLHGVSLRQACQGPACLSYASLQGPSRGITIFLGGQDHDQAAVERERRNTVPCNPKGQPDTRLEARVEDRRFSAIVIPLESACAACDPHGELAWSPFESAEKGSPRGWLRSTLQARGAPPGDAGSTRGGDSAAQRAWGLGDDTPVGCSIAIAIKWGAQLDRVQASDTRGDSGPGYQDDVGIYANSCKRSEVDVGLGCTAGVGRHCEIFRLGGNDGSAGVPPPRRPVEPSGGRPLVSICDEQAVASVTVIRQIGDSGGLERVG